MPGAIVDPSPSLTSQSAQALVNALHGMGFTITDNQGVYILPNVDWQNQVLAELQAIRRGIQILAEDDCGYEEAPDESLQTSTPDA